MKQSRRKHPHVVFHIAQLVHRILDPLVCPSTRNDLMSQGEVLEMFQTPSQNHKKHAAVRVKLRCHTLVFGIALVNVFLKPNSGLMISISSSGSMKCPIPNNVIKRTYSSNLPNHHHHHLACHTITQKTCCRPKPKKYLSSFIALLL